MSQSVTWLLMMPRAGAGGSMFRHVRDDVSGTRGLKLTSARGYIKRPRTISVKERMTDQLPTF